MKLTIWILTIIGILPVLFLSAAQIHSHLIMQRQLLSKGMMKEKPHFVFVSFKPVFKTGPFKYQKLMLSHRVWPAVVSFIGVLLIFTGLFFLIPKQVTVVENSGMGVLKSYLEELLQSEKPFTTLGIFSLDDKKGFSVWKKNGFVTVNLSAQIIPEDGTEEKIVTFFEGLGIKPVRDYKFQNGEIKDSARSLSYPVSPDLAGLTNVCKGIMKQIYNINEQEGLRYKIEKHKRHQR